MHIPDFLPQLTHGTKQDPRNGGCVMQVTSFLYDGGWTDSPECTDRTLANLAIAVNDSVTDEARRHLYAAIPELSGTAFLEIEEEAEIAATEKLEAWVYETFPFDIGAMGQVGEDCDECMSEWTCLAERLECVIGCVVSLGGEAPNFEGVLRQIKSYGLNLETDKDEIAAIYGIEAGQAYAARRSDWRERQVEIAVWFVAFVRKYREVFGVGQAVELDNETWQRVAEHMTPVPA